MLSRNVGNTDRVLRLALGVGLIALVFIGPKTAWGWIGLIPILTALTRICPVYSLMGLSSCRK